MKTALKTKEVSEVLGVNPTTVQRWAKYFGLVCETNEHGHFLFTQEHVETMREVQIQLQQGKKMKEIQLGMGLNQMEKNELNIKTATYEEKLEEVITRVGELDRKLSQKADEVVSYQLLKHRSELEDMMKMIKNLEGRLNKIENRMQDHNIPEERELPMAVGGSVNKNKWRSLMQIFSF
ncbi:chromosome-anchoring protein RacA [Halalkalibacter alkalisediminis]|uniref:Chromosome-anchoring protein RacA n=1 Tax=Halalkalibacter alkalisediminis TaxID=935616 RepID=A0ABV6NGS4_9BACI|nr:chromosome-anchoring protein RacA [Halalkalibacter alkalisediminis]